MTTGRELVPAQTTLGHTRPTRGEILRLLRQLRSLYIVDLRLRREAARAYDASHALCDRQLSHRIDLQL